MSSTSFRISVASGTVALVTLGSALSGCSITRDDEPTGQSSTASVSPSTSPSPTATVTVTESASPTPTETGGSTPSGPSAALLSPTEFPQLNEASAWTEKSTGEAGETPFGLCQKFDLPSIGATSVLERTLETGTGSSASSAGQQVADFADSQTAVRAMKVVRSWQSDCASRVTGTRVEVGAIRPVSVSAGTAWTYLVSYVNSGEGQFHSFGLVMNGTQLSLLRLDHPGQDHNYEPGQEPMELAVKAAATKLAG